jgi:hypothetical protein
MYKLSYLYHRGDMDAVWIIREYVYGPGRLYQWKS